MDLGNPPGTCVDSIPTTGLRTTIEGSQSMTFAGRMALTPSVEISLRLVDGVTGWAVDVRVRRVLIHQAAGFAKSGLSVSASYDPSQPTPLPATPARFRSAGTAQDQGADQANQKDDLTSGTNGRLGQAPLNQRRALAAV